MAIVEFENVTRIYKSGEHELRALDHVSFRLDEGKIVVILGPSGAGKSTLLLTSGKLRGEVVQMVAQPDFADHILCGQRIGRDL